MPLNLPGTLSVPRDAAVGTLLTPWITSPATTNYWNCNITGGAYSGTGYKPLLSYAGQSVRDPTGVSVTVFATGVPGIGLAIGTRQYMNGCSWAGFQGMPTSGGFSLSVDCNGQGNVTNGGQVEVALVVTGQVKGGVVSAISFGQADYYITSSGYGPSPSSYVTFALVGTTAVTALTCVTPNVSVSLGQHRTAEFSGTGSRTPATAFNLNFNACPAGMNTIKYEIDPVTTIVAGTGNSVVTLDSGSTATGIGLQLLDGNNNPFALGTPVTLAVYNSATGGDYQIPLKAAYYQTGATIGAGSANTEMTFTLTYQ